MADHLHRDRHVHSEPSVAGHEIHPGLYHSGRDEGCGGCQRGTEEGQDRVKKSNKASWFYDLYWEIDEDSFEKYLDKHPTLKKKGYDELVINNLDERDKNLKTKFGETIRVLDVPENLLIVEVTGGNYVGTLAICKNPDQITMKKAQDFGNMGDQILNYTKKNVLAINGSGFQDPNGEGIGGTIVGSFVLDGKEYGIYNIYYDTPDNFIIRQSVEKPFYKEKLRLRSYYSPAAPDSSVFPVCITGSPGSFSPPELPVYPASVVLVPPGSTVSFVSIAVPV